MTGRLRQSVARRRTCSRTTSAPCSVDRVRRITVRDRKIAAASRHYGVTVATSVPSDLQSTGRQRDDGSARAQLRDDSKLRAPMAVGGEPMPVDAVRDHGF